MVEQARNMRLTPLEIWFLARVSAGYEFKLPSGSLAEWVVNLAKYASTHPPKERSIVLKNVLHASEFEAVFAADTEAPEPKPEIPSAPRWEIIPAAELANRPKVSWLIDGMIVENGFNVLFGASGTYKTFTALDFALKVAQRRNVVYTIYEGISGHWQRIAAWKEHAKGDIGGLYVCVGALAIMDTSDLERFIEEAKEIRPALVVIDTLARAMTGADENSTRDMGLFVDALDELRRRLDCAVLVVHHTNKGGIQERGSVALRGAADVMIKQSAEDEIIIRECAKMKDGEEWPAEYLRPVKIPVFLDGEVKEIPVLEPTERVIDNGERLTRTQIKVLDVLTWEIFSEGATVAEISESLPDMNRGSINRILSRLIKYGLVHQSAKREPYRITEEGLTRLNRLTQLFTEESEQTSSVKCPESSSQPSHSSQLPFEFSTTENGHSRNKYYSEGL